MSNRIYPNIDGEKKAISGKCLTCGINLSQSNEGTTFNVEYDYMNGNDEDETYCRKHAHERRVEIKQLQKHQGDRIEASKAKHRIMQTDHFSKLLARLNNKYEVKKLTEYQWRINGVLDLYPTNRLYHDIKNNKRGNYRDAMGFCEKFFKLEDDCGCTCCPVHRLTMEDVTPDKTVAPLEMDTIQKGFGSEGGGWLHKIFPRIFP